MYKYYLCILNPNPIHRFDLTVGNIYKIYFNKNGHSSPDKSDFPVRCEYDGPFLEHYFKKVTKGYNTKLGRILYKE